MENSETKLTALQFKILDGMADDYEDVEQLYLYANRDFTGEKQANVQFPQMVVEVRFPLRDIVDEMVNMLREGYIFAKYSNDERFAPLDPLNWAQLHQYWFGATGKGTQLWKVHAADDRKIGVEDENAVDLISIDERQSAVILTVRDHLDWSDTVHHQALLQAKLNRYLIFVESGELLTRHPTAKGLPVEFKVVFKFKPDRIAEAFIEEAKEAMSRAGFKLQTTEFTGID
jgi:hypothetical protein